MQWFTLANLMPQNSTFSSTLKVIQDVEVIDFLKQEYSVCLFNYNTSLDYLVSKSLKSQNFYFKLVLSERFPTFPWFKF